MTGLQEGGYNRDDTYDGLVYLIDAPQERDGGFNLVDRYIEGNGSLHCHFSGCFPTRKVNLPDYCAIFQPSWVTDDAPMSDMRRSRDNAELRPVDGHGERSKEAMLILVRKFSQIPEGVTFRSCPSLVRLQALDSCDGLLVDSFQVATGVRLEGVQVSTDRKLREPLPVESRSMSTGQVECEMVERCSVVEDTVRQYKGEVRRWLPIDLEAHRDLSSFIVALSEENIWFGVHEGGHFPYENISVFLSALEFQKDAGSYTVRQWVTF